MSRNKEFDCVEMKYDLRRRAMEKWQGLPDDEIESRFERDMDAADDVLARWWRSVRELSRASRPDVAKIK